MDEEFTVYEGDIIIINDKSNVSSSKNRDMLEEGVPYFVERLGYSEGTFYISAYGKEVTIYDSDYKNIEHISMGERETFNVGDYVMITNDEKVEGALQFGFREGLGFEVKRVISENEIIISNGEDDLWIKQSEIPYVKSIENQNRRIANELVDKIEGKNAQYLIDKALDERDFESLKKLTANRTKLMQHIKE